MILTVTTNRCVHCDQPMYYRDILDRWFHMSRFGRCSLGRGTATPGLRITLDGQGRREYVDRIITNKERA